jgi:15-cis-phytoene desaturase
MGNRVIVLGAGVAGLTAAHELAEQGFEVTVYERRPIAGGKARSFPATIMRIDGENPPIEEQSRLPGEHGFRFFPSFYRHVFDTMSRIPVGDGKHVNDNLKNTTTIILLQLGGKLNQYPTQLWKSPRSWQPHLLVLHPFAANADMTVRDAGFFARQVIYPLLKACPERRFTQYEADNWWRFSQADQHSQRYRTMMASLTRLLVAAKADELSVRTGGYIMLALAGGGFSLRGHHPKVLNGPTNDAWITPWREYLESRHVTFEFSTSVEALRMSGDRVDEVVLSRDGRTWSDRARWYVAALDVDSMKRIVRECPELRNADKRLAKLEDLKLRWMNGIMIYLRENQKMKRGHTIYMDSPWALTSISQASFWPGTNLGELSDGQVNGILSVDISDWEKAGLQTEEKKPAKNCTSKEVFDEVCYQLRCHLRDTDYEQMLEPTNIYGWCLDPDIHMRKPGHELNSEKLLINTPESWKNRPPAVIDVENLFLAGDYVRTYTDLATMEGANESARRAVNGILWRSGAPPLCKVWPRTEGTVLAPLRWLDRQSVKAARDYTWARKQLAELKQKRS